MANLIVVSEPEDWPIRPQGCEVTTAREYLTNPTYAEHPRMRVINLCRSHRYQKAGYYVSLMAAARGHKPMPPLATIQELKSATIVRMVSEELSRVLETSLGTSLESPVLLDVLCGRDPSGRFERLAAALFKRLPVPSMRFVFTTAGRHRRWQISSCNYLPPNRLVPEHREFLGHALEAYLGGKPREYKPKQAAYDLAILRDDDDLEPPSDELAIRKFVRAAEAVGLAVEIMDKNDFGAIPQFDALFIRETTAVNHRTYRFAQRAAAEGLVVIDDPESILRCTNKVFLAEMLARYEIPAPPTAILHRANVKEVLAKLGVPVILKQPDSSFSQGVVKASTVQEFETKVAELLKRSELIIAQAFMPTEFDWRIGVLGRRPLYACKYFMAARHWQIIRRGDGPGQRQDEGNSEAVPLGQVPRAVVESALRAANLMGDGLYGVDVKEIDGRAFVIEVNDNPSIDSGYEDALLGQDLYLGIMREFRRRLDARRGVKVPP